MSATLHWFRVETNAAGKVVDVRLAQGPKDPEGRVFHVQAESAAAATAIGRTLYTEYCRNKVRETRARNHANGLCRCGAKREDRGFKKCSKCRRLDELARARYDRRRKGEDVPPPDRFETVAAEKARARDALRAEVLIEVRRAWAKSQSIDEFARWLKREIEAAQGKAVA